jgi:hypothetical protein
MCFLIAGGSRLTHHGPMDLTLRSPHCRAGALRCASAQAHASASASICRSAPRRLAGTGSVLSNQHRLLGEDTRHRALR